MIILDTSFIVAIVNRRDKNHVQAVELFREITKGVYGRRITIDFVLDEAITLSWIRTKNEKIVDKVYNMINGPNSVIELKPINFNHVESSWKIYRKYFTPNKPLSFTDAVIISFAQLNSIKKIASFDAEFDGILERIH